jgi:N6-adenosine-specific RNA methylase IME4
MTLTEIKALPVPQLAADDCTLFPGTTFQHLQWVYEVIEACGFSYRKLGVIWG